MMLLLLFVVVFDYKKYKWVDKPENAEDIDQSLITLVLLLNAIVLTYSVIRIRRRINRLPNAFPNENLIAVHVLNSFIYTLLQLIVCIIMVLQNTKLNEKELYPDGPPKELILALFKIFYTYDLVYIITLIFQLYMDCFLLYLILRFTNANARDTEKDQLLGR